MAKPGCTARYLTDLEDDGYVPCFKAKGHKGAHTSNRGHHWKDDHPRHVYATVVSGAPHKPATGETAEELARENEALREDAEDYQNRIEDLKEQVERLTQASGRVSELEDRVTFLQDLVVSMRINGARHHFVFAYDRYVDESGRRLQFCKECDKDREHPAHFSSGATYLNSREVEKAVSTVQERLVHFLREGMSLRALPAAETVRGLLQGLPGILPVQSVKRPPNLPGIGTRLKLKDVPANEAGGPLTGVLESYTDEDGFWVRYDDETPIKYENAQITQFRALGRKQ